MISKVTYFFRFILSAIFFVFLSGVQAFAQERCGAACVFAGPRLASVQSSESELLNPVLSGLLGTHVSISVLDWNAIASAELDLLGVLGESGQDIIVSDPSQVANIDLTLLELIEASAVVAEADGDTALVSALNALSIPIAELNQTINLADLISINLPRGALAELELNALDLIGGAIQLYNYENVVTTTQPVALDSTFLQLFGIGGAEILLQVIEPPHFECGGAGTTFHTSTIRAKLSVDLADISLDTGVLETALGPVVGGLVAVDIVLADIDLYFEFGRVDGEVVSADPVTKTASVVLAPSAIDLYLGGIDDAIFFNREQPIQQSDVDYATLGALEISLFGGLIQQSAAIDIKSFAQSAPSTGETLFFSPPYPQRQAIGDGVSSFSNLVGTLAQSLDIEVRGSLGGLIDPVVDLIIEPLLKDIVGDLLVNVISPVLDISVDPLLAFLGIGIGEGEVAVLGVTSQCLDFSDCPVSGPAPDGFSIANYGAPSHVIYETMFMGLTAPDEETGSLANSTATGDDDDGLDDEDGVSVPPLIPGQTQIIEISVTETSGESGYLQGWIDWNGDGSFSETEQVAKDVTLAGGGVISLSVIVPTNARLGQSFARFRWSTEAGLSASGAAPDGEVEDMSVVVANPPAPLVAGKMHADTGSGSGIAHDAIMNGNEVVLDGIVIRVETLAGEILAETMSNTSGDWSLTLPAGTNESVVVLTVPPVGWLTISETTVGPSELVVSDNSDGQIVLNISPTSAISDLSLGLVPMPRLFNDVQTFVQAGQVATLRHQYVAGSPGTVSLGLADVNDRSAGSVSVALYLDNDCDGTPDIVVTGGISMEAEDRLCLVSRVATSSAAANGVNITYRLTAETLLKDTNRQILLENFDRIIIGRDGGGLIVEKSVENLSRMSGETSFNTGGPGDVLLYRLKVENLGFATLQDVKVYDQTPPYTNLDGEITQSIQLGNGTECTLNWPETVTVGYVGDLRWECNGAMEPGTSTTLKFTVRIQN